MRNRIWRETLRQILIAPRWRCNF